MYSGEFEACKLEIFSNPYTPPAFPCSAAAVGVRVIIPGFACVAVPLNELAENESDPLTNAAVQFRLDAGSPRLRTSTVCAFEYPPPCRAWNRIPVTLRPRIAPLPDTNSATGILIVPPLQVNTITS